jgi:hypothetical protein
MAVAGTAFNWVLTKAGTWTRIAQGPLVHGFPIERLELSAAVHHATADTITWKLDCYSAGYPWYDRQFGTTQVGWAGAPPDLGGDLAYYLFYPSSPWVEIWILTNKACFAHIKMI